MRATYPSTPRLGGAFCYTYCMQRLMIDTRAASFTKRSIKKSAKAAGLRLALSMLDLTTLEGADTPGKITALCRKGIAPCPELDLPSVAAVCVYPSMVALAKELVEGTGVRVASVASAFPSGQYPLDVRLRDVEQALQAGADEIDMVINRGAFLSGNYDRVANEIRAIKRTCGSTHLKVILETGELATYDNIRKASDLAIQATADADDLDDGEVFIKTSTGKVNPAATLGVTLVMLEAIRDHYDATGIRIGMKPAGGIKTAKQSLHYLVAVKETLGEAWLTPKLFRFGASSLANDLIRQLLKIEHGTYQAAHDVGE